MSRHARGVVLDTRCEGPAISTQRWGGADQVWTVATWDAENHDLVVFLVNGTAPSLLDSFVGVGQVTLVVV